MRDYTHFLFYAQSVKENLLMLDSDESHHAIKVLRLKNGDFFQASTGDGILYTCKFDLLQKNVLYGTIVERTQCNRVPLHLNCYIGVPDREPFESLLTDLTAIGVRKIVPVITEHTQNDWWTNKWDKLRERFENKMISAMKQSLYPYLPDLHTPQHLSGIVQTLTGPTILADIDGPTVTQGLLTESSSVNILIGPPGGFSSAEMETFKTSNFSFVKIAPTRLRTEVAAIVLCAQIIGYSLKA
jgi:16S rRNA (uracil1498-N3)-methyltransferase